MAELYTPTLTYDPITDPRATQATHYQLERSPGDGFVYEAMADPLTGTATPFYDSASLIIATAGKGTRCCLRGQISRRSHPQDRFHGERGIASALIHNLFACRLVQHRC